MSLTRGMTNAPPVPTRLEGMETSLAHFPSASPGASRPDLRGWKRLGSEQSITYALRPDPT